MKRRPASWILILLLLAACGGGGTPTAVVPVGDPGEQTPPPSPSGFEDQVLALVNAVRADNDLAPLAWHAPVAEVARAHSEDMAVRDFFDHVNPDGLDPGDRIAAAGIHNSGWGENIAAGYFSPESVMDAWMNSPGHRANILSPNWTHLGVGIHEGGTYGVYWTQDFLRLP